jgi:hypothetical protein
MAGQRSFSKEIGHRTSGRARVSHGCAWADSGERAASEKSPPCLTSITSVDEDPADRSPWYVRTWGWILLAWGLLNLLALISSSVLSGSGLRPLDFVLTASVLIGAVGLLSESRWGRFLGLLVGILSASLGVWSVLDVLVHGDDITRLGEPFVSLFFLVLPGSLLIFSLLTPRTRTWLRERSAFDA